MTLKALPILYINLGGEMVYILNHRLMAQNIPLNKVARVIGDLLKTMFNQKVMQMMFQPDALYSHSTWKTLFDKIAHSSVMKLNTTSMNKLYDLMVMAVKYQMVVCKRPQDILLITLIHLDEVRSIGPQNDLVLDQIFDTIYDQMRIHYSDMSVGDFMFIRSSLLQFFKDSKIRVSLFLKDKLQHNSGTFVLNMNGDLPIDYQMPGTIKVFTDDEKQPMLMKFDCGIRDMRTSNKRPSHAKLGDRIISLGTNMYSVSSCKMSPIKSSTGTSDGTFRHGYDDYQADPKAKAQIDFLTHLIGMNSAKSDENVDHCGDNKVKLSLDLFDDDCGDYDADAKNISSRSSSSQPNTIDIDATKRKENEHLLKVMDEMKIISTADQQETDLFELIDDN